MLNRRQLRIKVLQALYAYHQTGDQSISVAAKNLITTTRSSYDLYLLLLQVFPEILHREEQLLSLRAGTETDGNAPLGNLPLVKWLQDSDRYQKLIKAHKISWANHTDVINKLFHLLKVKDEYVAYNDKHNTEKVSEKEFTLWLISKGLLTEDVLVSAIDEINVYYASSYDNAVDMIYKSVKAAYIQQPPNFELLDLYKDKEEDEQFIKELFVKAIENDAYFEKLISEKTDNWEVDRIAMMDTILLKMALAEITHFKNIPVKVSINEYIELSKNFSTPKSRVFINGVLDKIMNDLKTKGEIVKTGRGLIE